MLLSVDLYNKFILKCLYKITVCVQFITLFENKYIIIKNNIFLKVNGVPYISTANLTLLIRSDHLIFYC